MSDGRRVDETRKPHLTSANVIRRRLLACQGLGEEELVLDQTPE